MRSVRFLRPLLFSKSGIWRRRLSPLRRRFSFAILKGGQLPISGWLIIGCRRNRTRLARLRARSLDYYIKRHPLILTFGQKCQNDANRQISVSSRDGYARFEISVTVWMGICSVLRWHLRLTLTKRSRSNIYLNLRHGKIQHKLLILGLLVAIDGQSLKVSKWWLPLKPWPRKWCQS